MKQTTSFSNRLDESTGSIQVTHNNAMQTASQTTESPATAKKSPPAPKRISLLAVLAVGVDAAASFLKSKMEKAAALASQVGAVVLKSKKAISAAAADILVGLRPELPKKARLVVSTPILALLAGIFIAQPQAMAIHFWYTLPKYNEKETEQYISLNTVSLYIPILRVTITIPAPSPEITQYEFNSEVHAPESSTFASQASENFHDVNGNLLDTKNTYYFANGGGVLTTHMYLEYGAWKNFTYTTRANALKVKDHSRVGKVADNSPLHFVRRNGKNVGWINQKIVEKWENWLFIPDGQGYLHWNDGIPRQYIITYSATSSEDDTVGSYELTYWGTMYGPNGGDIFHDFRVPSNMSMPSNGYLEYNVEGIDIVRPSDDDDDE